MSLRYEPAQTLNHHNHARLCSTGRVVKTAAELLFAALASVELIGKGNSEADNSEGLSEKPRQEVRNYYLISTFGIK